MPQIAKVLVPLDIDVDLLDRQRRMLHRLSNWAERHDEANTLEEIEGVIGIIDAITDEISPAGEPCVKCGCTETPLHTNRVCGNCHEPTKVRR